MKPLVKGFFHEVSRTIAYVVADEEKGRAAVIDPVLDYDRGSGRTSTVAADALVAFVTERRFTVDWILETHAHADHVTAAQYLKDKWHAPVAIGRDVVKVQSTFKAVYNLGPEFRADGSEFDRLLVEGESLPLGRLRLEPMATPGHTPACMTYLVGDAAFVGDTLFMPDYGSARTDFPGGDAATLYDSVQRILALPLKTRLFLCHDYAPNGRAYAWESTVADERAHNIHLKTGTPREAFVKLRRERDAALEFPDLLVVALQLNIRAGRLPPAETNGVSYLKIPINGL